MPVYNAGDYLVEAIESIRKQTYRKWELICVDDGSTDESAHILKRMKARDKRIRIIRFPKNKGLAFALNTGINQAKGYYFARMDADDVSLPKRLEIQLRYLKCNSKAIAVGSQVNLMDENGRTIGYKRFPVDPQSLYRMMGTMMAIQHPTLMTYTNVMKKCKYSNHTTAEDVSMFFKLLRYGDFLNTKETLFKYRIRENSNSLKNPKKTFNLTLRSRLKAVIDYGYRPTIIDVLTNLIQYVLTSVLPNKMIIRLYKYIRFKHIQIDKIVKKIQPAFTIQ